MVKTTNEEKVGLMENALGKKYIIRLRKIIFNNTGYKPDNEDVIQWFKDKIDMEMENI